MKNIKITLITGLLSFLLSGFQHISYAQKGASFKTNINTKFEVKPQNLQYNILSLDGSLFEDTQVLYVSSLVVTNQTRGQQKATTEPKKPSRSYSSRSYISSTQHQTQIIPSYKYQAQTSTLDVGGLGRLVIDVANQLAK